MYADKSAAAALCIPYCVRYPYTVYINHYIGTVIKSEATRHMQQT